MNKEAVTSKHAPGAIGPYSQGIRIGYTLFLSGQIGLDPSSGQLVDGLEPQTHQVFKNLRAVMQAGGGELDDIVKVTLMLADLADFAKVNEIMATYFRAPYPARATYQVAGLPRGARVEVDGIAILHPADTIATGAGSHDRVDQPKGQ